jgi:hypothetical protein
MNERTDVTKGTATVDDIAEVRDSVTDTTGPTDNALRLFLTQTTVSSLSIQVVLADSQRFRW